MKVYIQVVAFDEELGMKSSREEELEVPGAVLKLHEMFANSQDNITEQMLNVMRDAVFMGAAKELQASRRNPGAVLNEQVAAGGKVGGSSGAANPLGEMLGLDLIQNANRKAAPQQPAHQPPPQARPAPPPQMGPGPVGFGPHRSR